MAWTQPLEQGLAPLRLQVADGSQLPCQSNWEREESSGKLCDNIGTRKRGEKLTSNIFGL